MSTWIFDLHVHVHLCVVIVLWVYFRDTHTTERPSSCRMPPCMNIYTHSCGKKVTHVHPPPQLSHTESLGARPKGQPLQHKHTYYTREYYTPVLVLSSLSPSPLFSSGFWTLWLFGLCLLLSWNPVPESYLGLYPSSPGAPSIPQCNFPTVPLPAHLAWVLDACSAYYDAALGGPMWGFSACPPALCM